MGSRGEADVGLRDVKVGGGMPGFGPSPSAASHAASIGSDGNGMHLSQVSGLRGSEQSMRQHIGDAIESSRSALHFDTNNADQSTADPLKFASFSRGMFVTPPLINDCRPISSDDANPPAIRTRAAPMLQSCQQNGQHPNILSGENWGESPMADTSPRTDTSTEDTDDKSQRLEGGQVATLAASDSSDRSKEKSTDQKTLRRLAQNREAARKSRLRKKAYVQQLENSRLKLTQLEQELHRARQQGIFISSLGDQSHSVSGNGALTFDMEYGRWLEEHNRQTNELRAAVNSHASDTELRTIVDGIMAHYKDIFRLKGIAAKADVFHVLSGMWKTPAERCFLWLGGFRSSELLKLLASQLEPLTEQQLKGIRNLQESSQQAEDALSQGMEALLQSLTETLASGSLGSSGSSGNVANYMGQMAMAMGKLGTLENFLIQADNLRQQTMEQLLRILTTRQAARALLAISDYFSRLRALSSLWLARPRE